MRTMRDELNGALSAVLLFMTHNDAFSEDLLPASTCLLLVNWSLISSPRISFFESSRWLKLNIKLTYITEMISLSATSLLFCSLFLTSWRGLFTFLSCLVKNSMYFCLKSRVKRHYARLSGFSLWNAGTKTVWETPGCRQHRVYLVVTGLSVVNNVQHWGELLTSMYAVCYILSQQVAICTF